MTRTDGQDFFLREYKYQGAALVMGYQKVTLREEDYRRVEDLSQVTGLPASHVLGNAARWALRRLETKTTGKGGRANPDRDLQKFHRRILASDPTKDTKAFISKAELKSFRDSARDRDATLKSFLGWSAQSYWDWFRDREEEPEE